MTADASHKSAFVCSKGQFEYVVMPMGLINAPSTFQHVMHDAFRGLEDCTGIYLDDLIVASHGPAEQFAHLRRVFGHLRERQLKLKRSKCHFLQASLRFLGHIVSAEGV